MSDETKTKTETTVGAPPETMASEATPEAAAARTDDKAQAKKLAKMDREIDKQTKGMAQILEEHPKVTVKLRQNPPGQPQLEDPAVVWINGHQVDTPRGVVVEIPKPVFDILENSGLL